MTVDEESRECAFIHSFPNSVYWLRVFVFTAVSAFSDMTLCVCVCRMNTAQ